MGMGEAVLRDAGQEHVMYETNVLLGIGISCRVPGRTLLHSPQSDVECAEGGGRNADGTIPAFNRLEFESLKFNVDIQWGVRID